ncbi:MAG: hypothetical protein J0I28_01720 [Caulobacterales bacterium]|nr:hypothetical protein [Caulobacterales bacterium]
MRLRLIALALGLTVLGSPPAWAAADYATILDLPKGTKIDFTVQRTRSGGSFPQPMTATFRYRQDIEPTRKGYRVRQKMTGAEFPPEVSPAERASAEQAAASAADITYEAAADLSPLRVEDWKGLVDRLATAAGARDDRLGEATRRALGRMSPEQAAQALMREQQMAASMQNVELELGLSLSETQDVPNPLGGGPPIASTYSIRLESLGKAAGRAVITTRQTLDPESAGASVKAVVEALAKQARGDAAVPLPPSGFRLERTVECRSVMDVATGLALSTDCTQLVTTLNEAMQSVRQTDRWVITQTIVTP